MYSSTSHVNYNLSFTRSFKVILLFAGLIWGIDRLVMDFNNPTKISVQGEYSPLHFPNSYNLTLSGVNGQSVQMKSLWHFQLTNGGLEETSNLVFELPFNGFYQVSPEGKNEKSDPFRESDPISFQKQIKIGALKPMEKISVLVWTDSELNPEFENATKLTHDNGSVLINYPVKVTGFLAWVERSKSILFFLTAMLFLFFLL